MFNFEVHTVSHFTTLNCQEPKRNHYKYWKDELSWDILQLDFYTLYMSQYQLIYSIYRILQHIIYHQMADIENVVVVKTDCWEKCGAIYNLSELLVDAHYKLLRIVYAELPRRIVFNSRTVFRQWYPRLRRRKTYMIVIGHSYPSYHIFQWPEPFFGIYCQR